jgi:hypothetical protein
LTGDAFILGSLREKLAKLKEARGPTSAARLVLGIIIIGVRISDFSMQVAQASRMTD